MFSRSIRSALVELRQHATTATRTTGSSASFVRSSIASSQQRAWLSRSSPIFNQATNHGSTASSSTSPEQSSSSSSSPSPAEPSISDIPPQMSVNISTEQNNFSTTWQAENNNKGPNGSNPPIPSLNTTDISNLDAEIYKLPVAPTHFKTPFEITKQTAELLPLLTAQAKTAAGCYITAHIHARPYLLTEGDTLRLPFLMPNVEPGDIIRLNRASVFGSRDFMLKGTPCIDERMFECRVCVLGTESEPLRVKEKTKRRQRHVQHIKSKHKFTLLKVKEVKIKTLEEVLAEGAKVVEA